MVFMNAISDVCHAASPSKFQRGLFDPIDDELRLDDNYKGS
jgi:hypothetical protein